jgi:hypothetical protein
MSPKTSQTYRAFLILPAFALLLLTLLTSCQNNANRAVPPTPADISHHLVPATTEVPADLVVLWNEVMLAAIRSDPPRPTVVARSLFMTHAAMYDAWAMYEDTAMPTTLDPALKRPVAEHTEANKAAAITQAACHMLMSLFPAYEADTGAFTILLHQLGEEMVMEADPNTPAGLGFMAAEAILNGRADDGSNEANNFADVTSAIYPELYAPVNSADPTADNSPGHAGFNAVRWQPLRVPTGAKLDDNGWPIADNTDPATYKDQVYLTPHWGAVRPFALTAGNQFRPSDPPQFGSAELYTDGLGNTMTNDQAYQAQVDEILHLSANLTDEQKAIAEYWADGPRSETPPGHWNALAHGISYRDQHRLDEDVKMYFALNAALFDSSIAAWDAKRAYDCIRPISAIRHKYAGQMVEAWGGPNMGTQLIAGETWRPYQIPTFLTPPFAEYVSGHSTFSASAAEVLTRFTGSNQFYDGETILYHEDFNRDGVPDILGQHIAARGSSLLEGGPAMPVVLQWETFQEAADEAGLSRRYGGIHFQDGDLQGRKMGSQIGAQAYTLAEQYWTGEIVRP